MDLDGNIIGNNASGRLFREYGKRDAEGTLKRCAIAGYDAEQERVTVRQIERVLSGKVAAGGMRDWLEQGLESGVMTVPLEDQVGVDPESWHGTPPAPGKPVFVLVHENERCEPTSRATESQAPHHIESITRPGPNAHETVHPQTLTITAGARLGGARDVIVMSGEVTLGKLFRKSRKRVRGETEETEYPALISLPVHRAVANAGAMGAGTIRLGWHSGAPWSENDDLLKRNPDLYGLDGREKDDPLRYDAEGGRATPIGQLEIWGETAEERGQAIEREDILDARVTRNRDAVRVTCIADPKTLPLMVELLAETRWDAVEISVPEPLWRLDDTARTMRECASELFAGGSARAMPNNRVSTEPTKMHLKEIAISPAGTKSLSREAADIVLLGDINPSKREHRPIMDWIAQATREGRADAPIIAVGANPFSMNAGHAIVWGSEEARRAAGLKGEAAHEDFVRAHPETARWLLAHAHCPLNALKIENQAPHITLPSEHDDGEVWEKTAARIVETASDPSERAVLGAIEKGNDPTFNARTKRINTHDLEEPPSQPSMRVMGEQNARKQAQTKAREHAER